jgi:TPR repeat protein
MSENNRKDFDMEEDPFAGAPGLDPTLEWSEEAYYLVLLAKDASEIENRTDISADDWCSAAHRFDFEEKHEKAALGFTKAAELGNVLAKFYLAQCYENGKGVAQDYIKAAELYIEVSDCENREKFTCSDPELSCVYPQYEAEYAIGSFYERGLLPDSTMEKAVEWYLRAQNDGSNEADYKLVECYLTGKGVEQNYDIAAEKLYSAHHWSNGHDVRSFTFAKALDGKTETHQLHICKILADCYLNGIGTDMDEEKAHEYRSKAEALEAKLKAEAETWAEKMLKNIKNRVSLDDDEKPF